MPGVNIPDFTLFAQAADVVGGQAVKVGGFLDGAHVGVTDGFTHESAPLSLADGLDDLEDFFLFLFIRDFPKVYTGRERGLSDIGICGMNVHLINFLSLVLLTMETLKGIINANTKLLLFSLT